MSPPKSEPDAAPQPAVRAPSARAYKLGRASVVQAALELLNEGGLDTLSTRRLATVLGVQSPALYWHFQNKRALLDAMAEAMLAHADLHGAMRPGVAWQTWLAENARRFRRALLAYRDGARVHAGTRPGGGALADVEAQTRALCEAGFTPEDALTVGLVIGRYVVGWVLEEQADLQVGEPGATDVTGPSLPEVDPAIYPTVARGLAGLSRRTPDAAFEAGLALLIAGLEARLSSSAASVRGAPRSRRSRGSKTKP